MKIYIREFHSDYGRINPDGSSAAIYSEILSTVSGRYIGDLPDSEFSPGEHESAVFHAGEHWPLFKFAHLIKKIIIEPGYFADSGDEELHFESAESGIEAAREYVSGGDWGECTKTHWINVTTWRTELIIGGGELVEERIEEETHKIEIEPEEPNCTELENHAWDSSGVYGHGGGVTETEICRHCGTYRRSDSWAQDPFDGEQGLRSIEYREADEESLEYVANEAGE